MRHKEYLPSIVPGGGFSIVKTITEIRRMIQAAEEELASLDARRAALLDLINRLNSEKESVEKSRPAISFLQKGFLTNKSPQGEKVALFRSLFSGREDVYARRFESARTGKKGYHLNFAPKCGK